MSIVVVGSSNTDMIIKVPHLPKPGETILGGKFIKAAGGKGANQAVAAARSGGEVVFIAKVGNDIFGTSAVRGFVDENINIDFVSTDHDEPSGVAQIFVSDDGENCIAVASGANAKLSVHDIQQAEDVINRADILLAQLETPLETITEAVKIANKNNVSVILNPAPAQKLPDELLSQLTLITPNETEAEILTGIEVVDVHTADLAATSLKNKGVKSIIITMGTQGAYVDCDQGKFMVDGFNVRVVDTTGAGDTFNGALAVALTKMKSMKDAIQFANAAGALSVTKLGAQPSVPTLIEIEDFLNKELT